MKRRGSALVVALWAILLLTMLVSSLVYEMHLEARLTSHHRKTLKARYAAQAGIQWAQFMLAKSQSAFTDEDEYGEEFRIQATHMTRGLSVTTSGKLGTGTYTVQIIPEQGRRNVNLLERQEWHDLFEQTGVPEDLWDELIDCLIDWTDENDLHQLNGAESDDNFYKDAGYEVKNAPIDTLDELLMIKGWNRSIVYGGPGIEEDDPPITGVAQFLTTFGDGKVNVNTASPEVLMSLPYVDEIAVDEIINGRLGEDEVDPEDDGWRSVDQVLAVAGIDPEVSSRLSVDERRYLRIISIGESNGVKSGIWGIFLQEGRNMVPIFWREEILP